MITITTTATSLTLSRPGAARTVRSGDTAGVARAIVQLTHRSAGVAADLGRRLALARAKRETR